MKRRVWVENTIRITFRYVSCPECENVSRDIKPDCWRVPGAMARHTQTATEKYGNTRTLHLKRSVTREIIAHVWAPTDLHI